MTEPTKDKLETYLAQLRHAETYGRPTVSVNENHFQLNEKIRLHVIAKSGY